MSELSISHAQKVHVVRQHVSERYIHADTTTKRTSTTFTDTKRKSCARNIAWQKFIHAKDTAKDSISGTRCSRWVPQNAAKDTAHHQPWTKILQVELHDSSKQVDKICGCTRYWEGAPSSYQPQCTPLEIERNYTQYVLYHVCTVALWLIDGVGWWR